MKNISITSLTVLIPVLFTFVSCGGEKLKQNPVKPETPKALQDDKLEIKSFRGYESNLVLELYDELVNQSSDLKKLQEDLTAIHSRSNENENKYDNYDQKSINYYQNAGNLANSIADSIVRKKVLEVISKSESQYSGLTAALNELRNSISGLSTDLHDNHMILKIMLTLPQIEKYQKENLPAALEFRNIIEEQKRVIKRLDSITPKY